MDSEIAVVGRDDGCGNPPLECLVPRSHTLLACLIIMGDIEERLEPVYGGVATAECGAVLRSLPDRVHRDQDGPVKCAVYELTMPGPGKCDVVWHSARVSIH